tara:strand:+ start:50725 stop:52896 length:2172 start_codon:yes stop_codon:yes gene_type:complete
MDTIIYTHRKTRLNFTNGCCGSGKSHSISELIAKRSSVRVQVCVGLTVELLKQWREMLVNAGCPESRISTIYTEQQNCEPVTKRINQWLDNHQDYPGILLITHKGFDLISEQDHHLDFALISKDEIDLYIDEMPSGFHISKLKAHKIPDLIKSRLKLGQRVSKCADGDYVALVEPVSSTLLQEELKNESHLFPSDNKDLSRFAKLMHSVLDRKERVMILESQWEKIGSFVERDDKSGAATEFLIFQNPAQFRGYHSVNFISADVETSLFTDIVNYHHGFRWNKLALQLVNDGNHTPEMLQRVKIYHVLDDDERFNSKEFLKNNGDFVDSQFIAGLKAIGSNKFGICSNNFRLVDEMPNRPIFAIGGHEVISSKSHGMNNYSHLDALVYDIAINMSPVVNKMLHSFGIDTFQDMNVNTLYQVAMRTSLRNPVATKDVNILVVDKPSAYGLAEKLGGGQVRPISDLIGTHGGFQHQLEQSTSRPRDNGLQPGGARPQEQVTTLAAGVEGATGASLGDTSSLVGNEDFQMRIIPNAPKTRSLNISKASPFRCIANYSHLDPGCSASFLTTKPLSRKLEISKVNDTFELKNSFIQKSKDKIATHFIPCNFQYVHHRSRWKRDRIEFVQSNMAVFEVSKADFKKDELQKLFNPKRGKKAFLLGENTDRFQLVFLLKDAVSSSIELQALAKPIAEILGNDVATVSKCEFFDCYEEFNCGKNRDILRHGL